MVVPWAIKTKLVTRYCSPQDLQVAQKMSAMGGLHEKMKTSGDLTFSVGMKACKIIDNLPRLCKLPE